MKITRKTDLPAIVSSKVSNFTPELDLLQKPHLKKQSSRKIRSSGGGVRVKKDPGKKGSRPETPLLRWKFVEGKEADEVESYSDVGSEKLSDSSRKSGQKSGRREVVNVSARKLAAGLWRLQMPEARVSGVGCGELSIVPKNNRFLFQPAIDHSGIHSPARHNRKSFDTQMKEVPQSPNSVTGSRNRFLHKLEPTFRFSNSDMEGATKWDPASWKASEDVKRIYGESKHLEEEEVGSLSMISALESELEQSRSRIQDLENERKSSKKKLQHFLKKLNEERATWRSREHEKIRLVIDDIKLELSRERKNRQRMEIVNSKLVNELADAKLSAKRYMQDYEKERKARELIEEVCDELAKEIGEDKAEIEALKRELMRMTEEVDDERKMLQMAEVWREERVQMKLVDAKVTLENKFSEMNKLVTDLETFFRSKSSNLYTEEMKRFETLKQNASSVDIQEICEFRYDPPNPDEIFSVFEGEMSFDRNDDMAEEDADVDDESGWETVSRAEEQGSSYSLNGSDLSINRRENEWVENEISKKSSSVSQVWFSNGTHVSPDRSSVVSGSEWSCSPGSGNNPHIMKGCIEWPRGVLQKNSLKTKLLEARMESQKIQLRQVLKQKI